MATHESTRGRSGAHGVPAVAAFLSFVWPGVGHWYLGRRRSAILWAAPVLVAVAVFVAQALEGPDVLAARLIAPTFALTAVILIALLALWRIVAMVDAVAVTVPAGRGRRRGASALAVGLAAVIVATHAGLGYFLWAFYDAGSRIFAGDVRSAGLAVGVDDPAGTDPAAAPAAGSPGRRGRITVLFTGLDSGTGQERDLTDTLLVVSFEPVSGRVAMVSFPRDIAEFPLYDGGTYAGRINTLMTWAGRQPERYPRGGLRALSRQLGYLLGVPVQYYAAVDLDGFRRLVDLVGGVDLVNANAIDDPTYRWPDGSRGFRLPAGPVHLDGETALAFVRSRTGAGDNDFTRAARQQALLVALRARLTDPALLPQIPALLDAAARMLVTDFPADSLADVLALAGEVDESAIERYVLGSPYSQPQTSQGGGTSTLRLDTKRLAALSRELFGDESRYAR